jgi:hypothetical protein
MSDLKLTISSWGQVMLDTREMKKLMRAAGNDVKNKTARLINASDGGGRTYRRAGRTYRASTAGNPPIRVSGALRASLKTYPFKSGEGFAVRARAFYALWLETGARGGGNPHGKSAINRKTGRTVRARGRYTTRVLEPRPFLDTVMAREAPELNRRVEAAMRNALTWKQTK